jgi:leucyl aminopeptidase
MEEQIRALAKVGQDGIKEVRTLDHEMLQKLGMNMFWNVGKAADSPPRCVIVHYEGNPDSKDIDLALVGKGVTYDTGGLHLKTYGNMEDMYGDKGGACAVIGALNGTMRLRPKKNIIFCAGLAENAIGASAYKPGDIVKSMKGLSVEIGNTDAEGRLVLGDCMTYVQREFKPVRMIDLATLTGACMIALGTDTAGMFTDEEDMVAPLMEASKGSFEAIWRLPINDEHREGMKGAQGDLNNVGSSRYGGASKAAAFLQNFVEEGTKWTHLDIAGPAMRGTAKPPFCRDQTGFGAALMIHYISNL